MTTTRLNLGCSCRIMSGWVNVDCRQLPGVDRVVDLDVAPWPWPDGSVDEILMSHCLEHVKDPLKALSEFHRILRVGGKLTIRVPHGRGLYAFTQQHLTYFSRLWFNAYFNEASPDIEKATERQWINVKIHLSLLYWTLAAAKDWRPVLQVFAKVWDWFWNRNSSMQELWEFIGIFPPSEITVTVDKK